MNKGYGAILLAGAASAALLTPMAAQAFESEAGATASPHGLEDIVVTANRRAERSQDVPIMISAFSTQELEKMNISEAQDLYGTVPSLVVGNQGTSSRDAQTFSIRGQSTGFLALPSVATYFSEVPLVATISLPLQGGAGNFVDLENVQVLSGPQGTLFGRNTTGGAVLLTPKRPTNELEGYIQGSIGSYDLQNIEGAINLPIVDDKLMVRVTGAYYDRRGFTKDLVWNKWRDDQHWYMGRVGIQLNPTETISNNSTVSASRTRNNGAGYVHKGFNLAGTRLGACAGQVIADGVTGCDVYNLQSEIANEIGPRRTRLSHDVYTNIDSFAAINSTDIELSDNLTLRNIISYQNIKVDYAGDTDGTPLQVYQLT
jgi:iron complex outermembrane receptor protein